MTWACDGIADCDGAEDEYADTCGNYCEHNCMHVIVTRLYLVLSDASGYTGFNLLYM